MVSIDAGNIYITTGTVDGPPVTTITGTYVKIATTKIDYNLNNPIAVLPIPVSKGGTPALQDNEQDPVQRAIDLKMIKETLAVQGFLEEETGERAITKRDNLLNFAKRERALKIVWGLGNHQTLWQPEEDEKDGTGVFITKMVFTEVAGQVGVGFTGDSPSERSIAVQIQFIRGKDM